MRTDRKTAIIVGALYILGDIAGILSVVLSKSTLDAPDYLNKVTENGNQIITGAFFIFLMGLFLAMIPVVMFPILKRFGEARAIGYVLFRGGFETVIAILMAISTLLIVAVSQAYTAAGATDAASWQNLGALLIRGRDVMEPILAIIFPLGALMFYTVLFQSRLIPRWLSGWGFVAAFPYLATGLFGVFNLLSSFSTLHSILVMPLGLQELVMAGWMIVKGFHLPAAAMASAPGRLNRVSPENI